MTQKNCGRMLMLFIFALTLLSFQLGRNEARAQSSYYTTAGCVDCHAATSTCNGCHAHGTHATSTKNTINLTGTTDKTSYAPGETVSVTIAGGYRTGWVRAALFDQNGTRVAVSSGTASGIGSSTTLPAILSAPAPATPGTYTWKAAWYGNQYDSASGAFGAGWSPDPGNPGHGYEKVSTNSFTVAAAPVADTTAPLVGTFTLPATATSLTVPVTAFTASDNVAVTGYLIGTSATAPAATAAGWSAAAPAAVTAVAGSNTFYAWAKDAAGNVSAAKSATVTVTLPDTTAPVVGSFTLPATATTLTVPVTAFTASDNVAVTGYLIGTSATAPPLNAAAWSMAPPAVVTAVAGSNTFYAWARDAAGNVSTGKSATVTVTIPAPTGDTTSPTLAVSALADGAYTSKVTLNISGSASDAGGLKSVTVNGQSVTVNADGSFSAAVTLVTGPNVVTVVATDQAGNTQSDVRTINFDPIVPVLTITAPADNSSSAQSFLTVTGSTNETSTVTVTDNNGNQNSAAITGNTFSATVNLVSGVNTITITATDLAGNITSAKRTVTYGPAGALTMAVTYPAQDITTSKNSLVLTGTVTDTVGKATVLVKMSGRTYKPKVDSLGRFKQQLSFKNPGLYVITVTAGDAAGNKSVVTRNVIYRKATEIESSERRKHYDDDHSEKRH